MKTYKRVLSGLLAVSMLAAALPDKLPVQKAYAAGLVLSPAYHADTRAAKFSHNEWTGKNGAEDVFAVNREAATLSIIPYQNAAAAAAGVWDYNARTGSDYFQLLTGTGEDWDLTVVQNSVRQTS